MSPPVLRGLAVGWVVLLAAAQVSCGSEPPPVTDQALRDSLGIPPDRTIHRIILGGRGGAEHVVPTRLEVGRGDLVQFLNVDRRAHSIVFRADSLAPELRDFLGRTSQLESPPLLDGGSRFVVTFQGAPPGEYPFVSEGPGGAAAGVIVVRSAGEG